MAERHICFDTETTGLNARDGDRVIEIGAVEMVDFIETGRTFQVYINPEREIPYEATRVHGLTWEMLKDKPVFADVVDDFLDFIGPETDTLVAHNAPFDMGFINAELERLNRPPLKHPVVDTVVIARQNGHQQAKLDTLMKHFNIDGSGREFHGGLKDSYLLARVYVHLLGRHTLFASSGQAPTVARQPARIQAASEYGQTFAYRPTTEPTAEELAAHAAFVSAIKDNIWASLVAA